MKRICGCLSVLHVAALETGMLLAVMPMLISPLSAQQQGSLKFKVDPGRAGVFIDGKYLGPAGNFGMARTYTVAAGDHEMKLVEPRYEEMTSKVTVSGGKATVVSEKMKLLPLAQPPFGMLRTVGATDKYDPVFLNGKFYGHAGEFNNSVQGLKLPPGDYKLKVTSTGGDAMKEDNIKIEAGKTLVVKVQ